ncbi:hypothetical protein A2483_02615 [Candidatus Peregrinibacteria bacterium RIFOXYC2_FULL_33_13]|nr:MAG: hypothetical protein UR27_C0010G0008 [Candidatus Peregrinibacteria bacterium GW2011_GWA2_33_10]KKP41198.1 MAG: hypothetical protein UR30_C0001G0045 [Candidatus Peregrinibacteria bacterium GW2011_GWC2_33_13]OGJ55335.1 MAG: hypothetical protein A2483_02615 [Candidatus Peregrinibacteria bacterium RIFOXYC2_FULL_33_13]
MQKFTIFTIIFSFAVILVMAELIINDYLETQTSGYQNLQTSAINNKVFEKDDEKIEPEKEEKKQIVWTINDGLFAEAGISNVNAKKVDFNEKLFQLIDLVGVNNETSAKFNVFYNDSFAITINEFKMDSESGAIELYDFINREANNKAGIAINEDNSFGDASFYINNRDKKDAASLVVKIRNQIFAFEYKHSYHPMVKKVLEIM